MGRFPSGLIAFRAVFKVRSWFIQIKPTLPTLPHQEIIRSFRRRRC